MPFLRISFPGKETPSTIVLRGSRITVGRRPENTIQIIDRILSGVHAELLQEPDGHYRLHDLNSTNGTSVNGHVVSDYQLTEPCKIAFGTVECQFDPGTPEGGEETEAEVLPTRAEVAALKKLNAELQGKIEVLREEVAALTGAAKLGGEGDVAGGGQQAELQKLILERAELRDAESRRAEEIARLQNDLALVRREGANLRNALKAGEGEIERLNAQLSAAAQSDDETVSLPAEEISQPAAPVAVQPPAPLPFPRVAKPVVPPTAVPRVVPVAVAVKPSAGAPPPPRVVAVAPPSGRPMPPTVRQGPASPSAPTAIPRAAGPTGTQRIAPPTSPGAPAFRPPTVKAAPTVKAVPKFVPTARPKAEGEQ